MVTEDESTAGAADEPAEPVPCSACRGTGQVVSTLGGQRRLVECPWCDGGGVRIADHDAQARRRDHAAASGGSPAGTDDDPDGQPDGEPPDDQVA